MNCPWLRLGGLVGIALGLLAWLSCGHDQQLVTIAVQPTTQTFGGSNIPVSADAGLTVQLRALGTYIHPPVTKDITNEVVWASNTPNMVTVSAGGLVTVTGLECGSSLVTATVTTNHNSSGALVTGKMVANVVCFTGTSEPTLTVNFEGTGGGTVISSPPGISCDQTCGAIFISGTTVSLTATPLGSNFGGWSGCDSVSGDGTVCTVDVTEDKTVNATFD